MKYEQQLQQFNSLSIKSFCTKYDSIWFAQVNK